MADRYRKQHRFWLDVLKPDEAALADKLTKLKKERVYQASIRDALQLHLDLQSGNLDVLLKQYPWIATALGNGAPQPATPILPRPQPKMEPQPVQVDTAATGEFLNMFDDFG